MTFTNNENDSTESVGEAARLVGGIWHNNGNGKCPLEEGVSHVRQQLQVLRAAQTIKQQVAIEQAKVSIERQSAESCLAASKAMLTQALKANDSAGAAKAICSLVGAAMRWFAVGGR